MRIERFEDILAWQKAKELTKKVYSYCRDINDFALQRAAVSIMNNVAEGFERQSNNEFKYFLYVAKGSCGEVRSMLILAYEINQLPENEYKEMYHLSEEISKMLSGLIKTL